jgi:hypothetical protein
VNEKAVTIWKEFVLVYFRMLFEHLLGGAEKPPIKHSDKKREFPSEKQTGTLRDTVHKRVENADVIC